MQFTSEYEFIDFIKKGQATLKLEPVCWHKFCWNGNTLEWRSTRDCHCNILVLDGNDKVGWLSGRSGYAFYSTGGKNLIQAFDSDAVLTAIAESDWEDFSKLDDTCRDTKGFRVTCKRPTCEMAEAFLNKNGYNTFYLERKNTEDVKCHLYLADGPKLLYSEVTKTLPEWAELSLAEAVAAIVEAFKENDVNPSMPITRVTFDW